VSRAEWRWKCRHDDRVTGDEIVCASSVEVSDILLELVFHDGRRILDKKRKDYSLSCVDDVVQVSVIIERRAHAKH
jgi:hypothetical protein